MSAKELNGAIGATFGIRRWDSVDELIFGCSQIEAMEMRLDRDRSEAWFTRNEHGHYVADPDRRAAAMFT
jgi:hypothetical protein